MQIYEKKIDYKYNKEQLLIIFRTFASSNYLIA